MLSSHCIYRINYLPSAPLGDGAEYVLVTEALYRHKTPDVRAKDCRALKKSFTKVAPWDSICKPYLFDAIEGYVVKPNKVFKENYSGFFLSKNQKMYGYHFFTYSLLNVPARYFVGLLKRNPISAFKVTNAILIIITCFFLLFYSPFSSIITGLISISFYFSSVYWYIEWTHTELFTTCLVTLSVWFFFQKKYYLALLLMALATTQNQPLLFVLIYLFVVTIFKSGLTLKTFVKASSCCIVCIIPPLFYYYNFNTFNLIKDAGFLDTQFQTFTRIFGFYFDLDQGVILILPLALFVYLFCWLKKVYLSAKQGDFRSEDIYLFFALIAVTFTISTMGAWNHGSAVVNRYATWVSGIILIHSFFLIDKKKKITSTIIIGIIAISQIITATYHDKITNNEVSWYEHKPFTKWVLNNYPALYNPDPIIFGVRTLKDFYILPETSPIIYFGAQKEICKIMCYKDRIDELSVFGIPKKDLKNFKTNKKTINGWVYINKGDFTSDYSNEKIYKLALYLKAKKVITLKIKENPAWYNHVKENTKIMKISEDSALVIDALYVLNKEEQNNK